MISLPRTTSSHVVAHSFNFVVTRWGLDRNLPLSAGLVLVKSQMGGDGIKKKTPASAGGLVCVVDGR